MGGELQTQYAYVLVLVRATRTQQATEHRTQVCLLLLQSMHLME